MSSLNQSLRRIIKRWPQDPLRSPTQFQTVLEALANSPAVTPRTVSAAQAICDDVAQKQYPLSDKTLRPGSNMQYYERLLASVEMSARGEKRSWWKRFFNIG
ncbi:hypothetical protein FS749_009422 [Ceratobasidium sp. UAMH 11750]|nr:hypothetical protein FS749_009422 [Ceratobasidium sp. UAMH 11750]